MIVDIASMQKDLRQYVHNYIDSAEIHKFRDHVRSNMAQKARDFGVRPFLEQDRKEIGQSGAFEHSRIADKRLI
jgi:hypothetical protein